MEEKKNGLRLEGQGVTKYFGGLAAVSDVSFYLNQGEILGLIGPNGAGKTTLFNIIAGVYKPNQGKIFFRGREISHLRPNEVCKLGIARTFQITKPFLEMTVLENALVGAFFGHQQRHVMEEAPKPKIFLSTRSRSSRSRRARTHPRSPIPSRSSPRFTGSEAAPTKRHASSAGLPGDSRTLRRASPRRVDFGSAPERLIDAS